MKRISENVLDRQATCSVICPLANGMKHNKCDYPQLRERLSLGTRERCACAGEKKNQCVLRCIRTEDGKTIVQKVLFYEEFKIRGDRDPSEEIRQAIQAYEEQKSLASSQSFETGRLLAVFS